MAGMAENSSCLNVTAEMRVRDQGGANVSIKT